MGVVVIDCHVLAFAGRRHLGDFFFFVPVAVGVVSTESHVVTRAEKSGEMTVTRLVLFLPVAVGVAIIDCHVITFAGRRHLRDFFF